MLSINIPDQELFDNQTQEFITLHGGKLVLEHSLLSVYKWESKWKKPFLSKKEKTPEESRDYIRCMVVSGEIDPILYCFIPDQIISKVDDYINDPMSATTFQKTNEPQPRDIVTAEIIYWEMTVLNIPIEFETRHLNHLLSLIKVCSIKNGPAKKKSKKERIEENRKRNEMNKKFFNTKG